MAFPTSRFGNLVFSLKVALISTGVLSVAVLLKLLVPLVTDFAVSELPGMYSSVLSWLRPPYLYLVINCIIISIVASSKLQLQKANDQTFTPPPEIIVPPAAPVVVAAAVAKNPGVVQMEYVNGIVGSEYEYQDLNVEGVKVVEDRTVGSDLDGVLYGREEEMVVAMDGGDEAVVSSRTSLQASQRSDSMEFLVEKEEKEKPLVSTRFGHKKSVKASPEAGKAASLGVSKSKRHDTLESTWMKITDGHPIPLTRHLKKSDTWDSHVRRKAAISQSPSPPPPPQKMKKSDTFHDEMSKNKVSQSHQESGKLRKEPSLSQDELNRRAEAFIKKFNEDMRLQRQESLNQYRDMLSRGDY